MSLKLDRLPWINVPPFDQILTDLISSCQKQDVRLISVQGPSNSGKSRLLTELLSVISFDQSVSLIALNGRYNDVFYYNEQEFCAQDLQIKDSDFIQKITKVLENLLQKKEHFYFLIDDFEALPQELMISLTEILSDHSDLKNKITFVVFMGSKPTQPEVRRVMRNAEILTINSMTIMQAKQFIDHVYDYTYQEKEIPISEVNQLHSMSYGYVGRLIKLLEHDYINVTHVRKWSIGMLTGLSVGLLILSGAVFFALHSLDSSIENEDNVNVSVIPNVVRVEPISAVAMEEEIPLKVVVPIKTIYPIQDVKPVVIAEEDFVGAKKQLPLTKVEKVVSQPTLVEKVKFNYVIELGRNHSKQQLEALLKGRSIPGKAQFKQIQEKNSKTWIAYIGPYSSEQQAIQGKDKLPASLQSLPLRVNKEF